ncbi:CaiB/BaiF CoA transferase family protein [Brevibacillus sp. NRS-1366]|uniref:CaiB/BaiF CoA transferase family protein n=1 Tax=Brevibacillus sp. NRS-1366 TaxID=3233899 RepID=UPI003D21C6B9
MVKGALDGIKVVDLSRQLAGPFCTMTMGDLGADVIKIEMPGRGDDSRYWGPFWNGESTYYMSVNRNKKSVELDVKSDEGREMFLKLVKESDVLIQNFRTGKMEKMGLGYEDLKKVNPSLIYCSISGYGATGALNNRVGLDIALQAFSGLMEITGYPDSPPVRVGISIADLATGMFALTGILAALNHRNKTGEGQKVDVSLMESLASWMNYHAVGYFATGKLPEKEGSGLSRMVPYQAYKTKDGYLVIGIGNDETWSRFCKQINNDELNDEAYRKNQGRVENALTLNSLIESILMTRNTLDWVDELSDAGVPCSPAGNIDYSLNHPQMQEREMVVHVPHPKVPDLKVMGIPMKFSKTPGTIRSHPPILGEHNEEILRMLKINGGV